jgi:hypothetical protein
MTIRPSDNYWDNLDSLIKNKVGVLFFRNTVVCIVLILIVFFVEISLSCWCLSNFK